MSQITQEEFLADVRHEVETIKKLATTSETSRLDLSKFQHSRRDNCIYGQMTGDCRSKRACQLITKACVRLAIPRLIKNSRNSFEEIQDAIDKPLTGEMEGRLNYFSMLETYLYLNDSKPENIINYLKGKTETLEL